MRCVCKLAQVKRMDDNCGECVECMGVASGCGEQEAGVASGRGWNLLVWLLRVIVRSYRKRRNFRCKKISRFMDWAHNF